MITLFPIDNNFGRLLLSNIIVLVVIALPLLIAESASLDLGG